MLREMVSHSYKQHKFPVDRYGSPNNCECGVTYDEHCRMPAPKERISRGPKHYKKYYGVVVDSFSTPRWNQGLGTFTTSFRNTEKLAKSKGLEPIGDCPVEKVFSSEERVSTKQIVTEAIKEFRKERRTLNV